jgi:hypothetical protein
MKGMDVTIFDDGRRPRIDRRRVAHPGIVPVLRKLGLEERAAGHLPVPSRASPSP